MKKKSRNENQENQKVLPNVIKYRENYSYDNKAKTITFFKVYYQTHKITPPQQWTNTPHILSPKTKKTIQLQ